MGVALGAIGLKESVVDNALAIASFVTGILLGLFLLGLLTRRRRPAGGVRRADRGARRRSRTSKFGTPLAYPWYALVGSATVVVVGLARRAGSCPRRGRRSRTPIAEPDDLMRSP